MTAPPLPPSTSLPRTFWLLPLLALAAWLPLSPYWQSDDYIAVHYARDLGNAARDFVGPQYAAADVFAFYRPLITASFWLDQAIGGPFPPLSHWSNALAHAVSTLLVGLLWRRFVPPGTAFAAAASWAVLPSHQGSIAWAVGRVDGHTAVWCLLAVWAALRAHERHAAGAPARRWLVALFTALALASKEMALVLPALAALAVACRAGGGARLRIAQSLHATAGAWAVLAVYVPWRWAALGGFGGYDAAQWRAPAIASGLANGLASVAVPLRWIGRPGGGAVPAWVWLAAAAVPVAVAFARGAWRRPRVAAAAAAAFVVALVPIANFVAASDNPQTLRLWYLPTIALAGVVAAGGAWLVLLVLVAWASPFLAMRGVQHAADLQSAAMHRTLLRHAPSDAGAPWFVDGLPRVDGTGTVVQFLFGVDRVLAPPFTRQRTPLYALRPLLELPRVFRLTAPGDDPFALPAGSTWTFADANTLRAVAPGTLLPDLPVAGDVDAAGVVDLRSPQLYALLDDAAAAPRLRTPGVVPDAFRLTVFTASGYLATVFTDHGDPGATDGTIDLRAWLAQDAAHPLRIGRVGPDVFVGDALTVPTVVDLEPEFPVLLEAGSANRETLRFTPTHRARRLLTLRMDRGYAAWRDRAQGR